MSRNATGAVGIPGRKIQAIRRRLLAWYRKRKRDLPWRRNPTPYRVWVSETMLQQTRVETVIPYYRAFLRKFPSVRKLAAAPEESVLKSWEGLGYYRRARNFHRAAKEVAADYGGRLPREPEALLSLPGIGRYTAGAIASIAFGLPEPVLDGNVIRVLARWTREPGDPSRGAVRERLWELAGRLVPGRSAGDFNQAMMELGATVCTPRAPDCDACPVRSWCAAGERRDPEHFPGGRSRPPLPIRRTAALLAARSGVYLIRRRPAEGLLGGLWEFPQVEAGTRRPSPARMQKRFAESLGMRLGMPAPLPEVRHVYSHFRSVVFPARADVLGGRRPGGRDWTWFRPDGDDAPPLTKVTHRILGLVQKRPLAGDIVGPGH